VLRGVDLTIRVGETVAFVGPSGAGKTTLCSLLPRFYDVTGGRITIDGVDIRDMTLASCAARSASCSRTSSSSAARCARTSPTASSTPRGARSARRCGAPASTTWSRRCPDGLDTVIGERGVKLSGGQQQRLAIARMFLKNPPILILDEATSALDTETERAIQRSLAELAEGRTTLVIAHRLATVRDADRIVVVDGGTIVEEGRHDDLLARASVYRRLHEAQFGRLERGHEAVVRRAVHLDGAGEPVVDDQDRVGPAPLDGQQLGDVAGQGREDGRDAFAVRLVAGGAVQREEGLAVARVDGLSLGDEGAAEERHQRDGEDGGGGGAVAVVHGAPPASILPGSP
jgi:ABC-type dipeptide/oligopeptide/nickel transport system ATPase subunit